MTTHRQPFRPSTKSPAWARLSTWALLIAGVAVFVVATLLMAYASDDGTSGLHVSILSAALFIVGIAAAVVGLVWDARLDKRDAIARATGAMGERMAAVTFALAEASTVIAELQAQMTAQVAVFDRVYAETDDYETRADLHRKEATAVSDLIATTMESTQLALARSHRRDQWLFFALGVLVAIPVQLLLAQLS